MQTVLLLSVLDDLRKNFSFLKHVNIVIGASKVGQKELKPTQEIQPKIHQIIGNKRTDVNYSR